MKYTIELTNKQKALLESLLEIIHRHIGFNAKLEPVETRNVEDTNEYLIGYKKGYDTARTNAQATKEEWGKTEYNRGYNSAINDYNKMIQWLHDCTDDFKKFINTKYGYDVMYLTNPRVDEGVILYDLICDHDIAEVISEFIKIQEEKKKAEEEIKVGDEVIITGLKDEKTKGVIIMLASNNMAFICLINSSEMATVTKNDVTPTGKHYDIESILKELGE